MRATPSRPRGSEPGIRRTRSFGAAWRRAFVATVLIGLAATLALGGCKATHGAMSASGAVPLRGTEWRAVDVGGQPVPAELPGGRVPFFLLDPGKSQVTGYSGLNNFFGGFDASEGSLSFGHLASTRRAGPPAAMAFESTLFKALGATTSYRIMGKTLELLDASGDGVARFSASAAP